MTSEAVYKAEVCFVVGLVSWFSVVVPHEEGVARDIKKA